jgi:hypothetical protein
MQIVPDEHAWLQQDVEQSPMASVLSPMGTHVTHVLALTSQTLVPPQPVLAVHEVAQVVAFRQA